MKPSKRKGSTLPQGSQTSIVDGHFEDVEDGQHSTATSPTNHGSGAGGGGGHNRSDNQFEFSVGTMTSLEAETKLALHGYNELPEKKISKLYIFLTLLCEPMPIMIWLAIIIEAVISKWMDMLILLGIQFCNASIAFYETTKAGDAVAALKASLKPIATVKRDSKWIQIDARLVVPGDLVSLATGTAVPADCRINHGTIDVDQAALTGESMAVTMFRGDSVRMGSTVVRGEVEGTVEFTGSGTFFGKTAALLQVRSYTITLRGINILLILFPCLDN
jgi:H+-transporting ATPase